MSLADNLKNSRTWTRGFFILVFVLVWTVAELLLAAVVIFQFFSQLLTGAVNRRLLNLGQNLATLLYQVALFLTFKSDERPYPFGEWPRGSPAAKPRPRGTARRGPRPRRRTRTEHSSVTEDSGPRESSD